MNISESPCVSVIIATLERHQKLRECLESLERAQSENAAFQLEVLVIDQSSKTFSPDKEYSFPLLITTSQKGASKARNLGLSLATGDYVWFLDDDAYVTRLLTLSKISSFNRKILFNHWLERPSTNREHLDQSLSSWLWLIKHSGTPFFVLSRHLAQEIGGFDENLGPGTVVSSGEDLDLLIRALRKRPSKERISYFATLSHENHKHPFEKRRGYAQSRGYVLAKNNLKAILILEIAYSFLVLLKGDIWRLWFVCNGFLSYWIARINPRAAKP